MADVHTPEKRSYNMSRIRSKDTNTYLLKGSDIEKMITGCLENQI